MPSKIHKLWFCYWLTAAYERCVGVERQGETERERQRQRQTEAESERERQTEKETERNRESLMFL